MITKQDIIDILKKHANIDEWGDATLNDFGIEKSANDLLEKIKGNDFSYCQREIELNPMCGSQCEHCKEYYKPLEDNSDIRKGSFVRQPKKCNK